MKYITLLMAIIFLGCSNPKVNEVAAFEFNNAWHWIYSYDSTMTKADLETTVNTYANPEQTSFFFFYPEGEYDLSIFQNEKFSYELFRATLTENKPKYGLYKMPLDDKIYDDGVWLMGQ